MKLLKTLPFLALLFLCGKAQAHDPERGKIFATLAPYVYRTLPPEGYDIASPYLGGAGFIVEGDIDTNGGLEVGLFYMQKIYFRETEELLFAEKIKRMHITLGYRHWFNDNFSAGLSFASSYSMGSPEVIHSDVPRYNLVTSAQDTTEYGFDFSFLWEMWTGKDWAVTLDSRYSISVTNKENEDADHYGFLLGLKYDIQSKK